MHRNVYFTQYDSPNIVIVPTVSFSTPPMPPETKQRADPIPSNCTDREQNKTPVDNFCGPTTSGSNSQQNKVMNTNSNTSISTSKHSDNFKKSPPIKDDITSTETPRKNVSQNINEISSSKYKSRNNLVDLTGFNLTKRDSMSSVIKRKDLKQIDCNRKIKQNDIKSTCEKQHRDYSNRDASKTEKIINKESSNSVKPMRHYSERNEEGHANDKPKENPADIEDKMKKYFRQLWRRNINKLKDVEAIKSSSKTKHESKDPKPKSIRSKSNCENVTKSNTAIDLRNKIKTKSKIHNDIERRFLDKYSRRSKSETGTHHLAELKESLRDRKNDSSSVSIKRYKDFQNFTRLNDHEIKYKSGNQNKTENSSHKKMVRMKSRETTTNNRDSNKNEDDRKRSLNEKHSKVSTNQTNTERVNCHTSKEMPRDQTNKKVILVKKVVQVDKNLPNKLSQIKCAKGVQDLRSRLSRKRSKSECLAHSHESVENRLDRENLIVTVNQDVKADSKNSASLASNVLKSKPRSCKKIKLIINIECPNSDSDDSGQDCNECCPPEDLSFLDDFNVDEIVDSLNNSQVERKKIITKDNVKAQVINKINENDKDPKHKTKLKDDLINDINIKATKMKKEEMSLHKRQVIEIHSDTEGEDLNLEIGSVANTKICKTGQNMTTNSKIEINTKHEVNNVIDITEELHEENALEKTMDFCDDSNDSVVEVIDITGENNHNTTSKHSLLVNRAKSSAEREGSGNTIKISHNTVNTSYGKSKTVLTRKHKNKISPATVENTFEMKVEQKLEPPDMNDQKKTQLQKSEDPIEASLETLFNHKQKKSVNNTSVRSDAIKQLNTKNVKVENESQNIEDTVEASLKTMFHNIEQNSNIRKHSKPIDAVDFALEAIFNANKQHGIKVPLEAKSNMVDREVSNKIKIKLSNKDNKIKPEYSQKTVNQILTETNKNSTKQKANNKINDEASNVSIMKENRSLKSGSISKTSLVNIPNKKANSIPLSKSDIAGNAEHSGNFKDTQSSNKYIQEKMGERPLCSGNSTKKTVTLKSCTENVVATHEKDIRPQSRLSQNNKAKRESLQISKEKNHTKENSSQKPEDKYKSLDIENIQKKADNKKAMDKLINTLEKKTNHVSPPCKNDIHEKQDGLSNSKNSNIKTLIKNKSILEKSLTSPQSDTRPQTQSKPLQKSKTPSKAIKTGEQTFGNKSKNDIGEKMLEGNDKNKMEIIPLSTPHKNVKEHLQIYDNNTDKKSTNKSINTIEKNTNYEKPLPPSKKICLETKATPLNTKSILESSQVKNNMAKSEPLKKSEETLITSETTITDGEQKTYNTCEHKISDKNKKEKPLLPIKSEEDIPEKSPGTVTSLQQDNKTSDELTNPNKNIADTSEKTSIAKTDEKLLMANNKQFLPTSAGSNVENQAKSLKTIDSDIDKSKKDSELSERCEIATKSAIKQGVSKKSIVSIINEDEAKIKEMTPLLTELQAKISQHCHTKFNVSSIIRYGQFSTIFKCNDKTGTSYAVKVVHDCSIGNLIEGMLFQLQQFRPRQDSSLLYLMTAFEIHGQRCLLTEYYPKNLEQVLNENKRSFHIDQVRFLSRQLVDAVVMLTNANIIHTDIKPSHILLNKAHDRLKLCGFDRSSYSYCANILPNTGTVGYRAPEVILGFMEGHKIDVWSTALVMFEMATNKKLFPAAYYNNAILYKQMCTFGCFDWSVVEQSRYKETYFSGTSFIRKVGSKARPTTFLVHTMQRNDNLRKKIYKSYDQDWAWARTTWQMTKDMDKLKSLLTLLEQMLTLDPRQRPPIQNGRNFDVGLLVLAKLNPLILHDGVDIDAKTCSWIQFVIEDLSEVEFFATHLKTSYFRTETLLCLRMHVKPLSRLSFVDLTVVVGSQRPENLITSLTTGYQC